MSAVDEFKRAAEAEKARVEALAVKVGIEVARLVDAGQKATEARRSSDTRVHERALATLRDSVGRLRVLTRQFAPTTKQLAPDTVATATEALERGEGALALLTAELQEAKQIAASSGKSRKGWRR